MFGRGGHVKFCSKIFLLKVQIVTFYPMKIVILVPLLTSDKQFQFNFAVSNDSVIILMS